MPEQLHGTILKASDFQVQGNKVYINPRKTGSVPGMILIHAFWCGHCKDFTSTFNKISDSLSVNGFCCASIESDEFNGQDALVTALNFQGFPTICFFDQTGMIIGKYEKAREESTLLDHICKVYHHCINKQ